MSCGKFDYEIGFMKHESIRIYFQLIILRWKDQSKGIQTYDVLIVVFGKHLCFMVWWVLWHAIILIQILH